VAQASGCLGLVLVQSDQLFQKMEKTMRQRLRFGAFLAPHHPLGEHPTLQFQRDLELAAHLDRLQFDEFWVGEHHSGGWETIGSPELFLAAAAERTHHIKLGTGVISVPYHHPFNIAQRMVHLDHLSRGRAILGVGPGALPSDAVMLGIDPMTQRDRMDEGLGAVIRLMNGEEPVTMETDWFTLNEAVLQLRPVQDEIPVAIASSISPSGMKTAGKYGVGVLSLASYLEEGLTALPTQWGFGQTSAQEHGQTLDRANWRIVMPMHLSTSKEQAYREVADGLQRWPFEDGYKAAQSLDAHGGGIFGSPEDALEKIAHLQELSGGFGTLLCFAHDWVSPELSLRSYDLLARHVMPQVQGLMRPLQASADRVSANKKELMAKAGGAILKAIREYNAEHPREES
jgi:limonene 1,2-monooxygenase